MLLESCSFSISLLPVISGEAEDRCRGSDQKNELESKPMEQGGGIAKKARVDLKIKAKTKTWSNVVKGLEEDELETTDSVEKSDSHEGQVSKRAAEADTDTEEPTSRGTPTSRQQGS